MYNSMKKFVPQVTAMASRGLKVREIAQTLGLTTKQVANIKYRHVPAVVTKLKRGEKAWAMRRYNSGAELTNTEKAWVELALKKANQPKVTKPKAVAKVSEPKVSVEQPITKIMVGKMTIEIHSDALNKVSVFGNVIKVSE